MPSFTEYTGTKPLDTGLSTVAMPGRVRPAPARTDPCAPDCQPRCPACGGLECLCRPRFFPGQLLTDDDLNRLQRYIVSKNKLHNRYLQGWGVACGMEVVCDPCDATSVTVRSGYALSPCGEDIVLCSDQSVDVCDLISACSAARDPVCDPPYDQPPRDCKTGNERWVIAICYDERPSRGITAITNASDSCCSSGCACGGSGACSCKGGPGACACGAGAKTPSTCSCGGTAAAQNSTATRASGYRPQCEPTQICEGYRFIAYPAPSAQPSPAPVYQTGTQFARPRNLLVGASGWLAYLYANRARFGALIERVSCCFSQALLLRQQILEGKQRDNIAALDVYQSYAQSLYDFSQDFGAHFCALARRVQSKYDEAIQYVAAVRAGGANAFDPQELLVRINGVQGDFYDILSECFCAALLPQCPEPVTSNCVPLAVVVLRRGQDCRVIEICNWEERRLLITWRNVSYWLSWLPWNCLQKSIADLCCGVNRRGGVPWLLQLVVLGMLFRLNCEAAGQRDLVAMLRGLMQAPGLAGTVPAPAQTIGAAALGGAGAAAPAAEAPQGDALQRAFAADDLLAYLTGEGEKLVAGTAPDAPAWASIAANLMSGSALNALARSGDFTTLSQRVADLEKQVAQQQRLIDQARLG